MVCVASISSNNDHLEAPKLSRVEPLHTVSQLTVQNTPLCMINVFYALYVKLLSDVPCVAFRINSPKKYKQPTYIMHKPE